MSTGESTDFWGNIYNMSEAKIEKETNFGEKITDDNELKGVPITGVELSPDHFASQQYIDQQVGDIAFCENELLTFNGDSWISTSPLTAISNASLQVDGVDVVASIQHLEQEIEKLHEKLHEQKWEEGVNAMAEEMRHEIDTEIITNLMKLEEIDHNNAFDAAMKGI